MMMMKEQLVTHDTPGLYDDEFSKVEIVADVFVSTLFSSSLKWIYSLGKIKRNMKKLKELNSITGRVRCGYSLCWFLRIFKKEQTLLLCVCVFSLLCVYDTSSRLRRLQREKYHPVLKIPSLILTEDLLSGKKRSLNIIHSLITVSVD